MKNDEPVDARVYIYAIVNPRLGNHLPDFGLGSGQNSVDILRQFQTHSVTTHATRGAFSAWGHGDDSE